MRLTPLVIVGLFFCGASLAQDADDPDVAMAALRSQGVRPGALSPEQWQVLQNINAYFNRIRVMSGSFTQVGADGRRTEGKFYISKPGKLRFQYTPPTPIELIADGQTVAVRDRKLNTQDIYSLSQTPLRFLLASQIDLSRDSSVIGVYGDNDNLAVTLEEKSSVGGSARINLVFSAQNYALQQWTITDAQGYDTTVAVYNLDTTKKLDPGMFKIDYTDYSTGNN